MVVLNEEIYFITGDLMYTEVGVTVNAISPHSPDIGGQAGTQRGFLVRKAN